jgi:hypothetical protein
LDNFEQDPPNSRLCFDVPASNFNSIGRAKKRSHGVSNGALAIRLLHTGQFFDFFHPNAIFLLLF